MKKKVLVVGGLISLGLLTACGNAVNTESNTTEIASQTDASSTEVENTEATSEDAIEAFDDGLDLTKVERVDITNKEGAIMYTLSDEELTKFHELKSTLVDIGGDTSESDIVYSFTCYENDEATLVFHRHDNDMLSLGGTYIESDDIDTFLYKMTENALKSDASNVPTEQSKY